MTFESYQAAEKTLLLQTYERHPLMFVGGDGVYLHDAGGNAYLDLLSGIGVSALGYGHPVLVGAIQAQAAKLIHTSNLFFHEHTAELALRLTEMSGMDRVFFCNSGTEAWEAALKIARAFAMKTRAAGGRMGTKFLALEHSFHGRTIGSVATTHKEKYRVPFDPVMPDVEFVRFNDVEDLRSKFSDDVCGICIEPIQGEGGIHPVTQRFFAEARALCDSTGALLIADEIQCGFGRTGSWFAYQTYGIQPDVTTIAKPLAGGMPIGAMLCTERVAAAITPGMHGTTFGGNPLACAAAIAVIDEMRRVNLPSQVSRVGGYFIEKLRELAKRHAAIVDVRGAGLMIGCELESEALAKAVATEMMTRRIILNRTSETVLRFLPPYILEEKHVDLAIAALDEILSAMTQQAVKTSAGEMANG